MCMCVCVYVHICIYTCIYVYVSVCVCVGVGVDVDAHQHIFTCYVVVSIIFYFSKHPETRQFWYHNCLFILYAGYVLNLDMCPNGACSFCCVWGQHTADPS